jgi:hypothetical protein
MNNSTTPLNAAAVASMLRATAVAIAGEARNLPEAVLRWHPAAGEWCVKDVIGHLIEAERRGFAGRIRSFWTRTPPPSKAGSRPTWHARATIA